jgi:hypothetical protein
VAIKVGFIGYSAGKFNKGDAFKILDKIFQEITEKYKGDIEIVSGATYYGIPAMVYDMASDYDYKTIGVMCKEGYDCDLYYCDEIFAIGENWGDESTTFIDMIDVLYRIGGGKQSLNEVKMAKAKGIPVYEYELAEIKDNEETYLH